MQLGDKVRDRGFVWPKGGLCPSGGPLSGRAEILSGLGETSI